MAGVGGRGGVKIRVHIERLILDGLPVERRQGPLVRASVEQELRRLLAAGGLADRLRRGGALPEVRAGDVQLAGKSQPARLGQQIARSVYDGIGRTI